MLCAGIFFLLVVDREDGCSQVQAQLQVRGMGKHSDTLEISRSQGATRTPSRRADAGCTKSPAQVNASRPWTRRAWAQPRAPRVGCCIARAITLQRQVGCEYGTSIVRKAAALASAASTSTGVHLALSFPSSQAIVALCPRQKDISTSTRATGATLEGRLRGRWL